MIMGNKEKNNTKIVEIQENYKRIVTDKIGELQKEYTELQVKLQQINQARSQIQTRLIEISGSTEELKNILSNMIEEDHRVDDSECKTE